MVTRHIPYYHYMGNWYIRTVYSNIRCSLMPMQIKTIVALVRTTVITALKRQAIDSFNKSII